MQDSTKKSSKEFYCYCCDYSTSRSSQYDRHLLTAKHQRIQEDCNKNKEKFRCSACDVVMQHLSTYNRHISTAKHKRMQNSINLYNLAKNSSAPEPERPSNNDTEHICECGKKYKFRQGLHKHKKTCSVEGTPQVNIDSALLENIFTPSNIMDFITNIVKTNDDMKQLMIQQTKHHMETEKKLIELIKEPINKPSS